MSSTVLLPSVMFCLTVVESQQIFVHIDSSPAVASLTYISVCVCLCPHF